MIMSEIRRKHINWKKTSKNLKLLRCDNINLRKYVCFILKTRNNECDGKNCDNCKFEMDLSISQSELAKVFNVSESMIANWENARSIPSLEDLFFYADICRTDIFSILVFSN